MKTLEVLRYIALLSRISRISNCDMGKLWEYGGFDLEKPYPLYLVKYEEVQIELNLEKRAIVIYNSEFDDFQLKRIGNAIDDYGLNFKLLKGDWREQDWTEEDFEEVAWRKMPSDQN